MKAAGLKEALAGELRGWLAAGLLPSEAAIPVNGGFSR